MRADVAASLTVKPGDAVFQFPPGPYDDLVDSDGSAGNQVVGPTALSSGAAQEGDEKQIDAFVTAMQNRAAGYMVNFNGIWAACNVLIESSGTIKKVTSFNAETCGKLELTMAP